MSNVEMRDYKMKADMAQAMHLCHELDRESSPYTADLRKNLDVNAKKLRRMGSDMYAARMENNQASEEKIWSSAVETMTKMKEDLGWAAGALYRHSPALAKPWVTEYDACMKPSQVINDSQMSTA